jgi:hypothetical protein
VPRFRFFSPCDKKRCCSHRIPLAGRTEDMRAVLELKMPVLSRIDLTGLRGLRSA